jgi:hypothetical protein
MSNTTANTTDEKLHIAITELVLDLKKDGTVGTLASKLGVSRNRLTTIFRVYDALLEGKEVPRSKTDPRPTPLCWDLDPLINISKALKIPLSDFIRAAEDVKNGLPPWFHARISENTQPQTRAELVNVFLEAAGCRTYAMKDPLGVRGKRKSYCHFKGIAFSEDAASVLRYVVDFTIGGEALQEFREAYKGGKISSTETYQMLKPILDSVVGDAIHNVDEDFVVLALLKRIDETRGNIEKKISAEFSRFLEKKNSEPAPDKGKKHR